VRKALAQTKRIGENRRMLGWFRNLLARFVAVGLELAFQLIRGVFQAPSRAVRSLGVPMFREATAEEVVPLRHKVLRPGKPRETAIWSCDTEAGTRHWILEDRGEIVACASTVLAAYPDGEGPSIQLRGMAVDPTRQGQGLGKRLLQGIEHAVQKSMWCNARKSAEPFYEATGWTGSGEHFDIAGIGPHRRMRRILSPQTQ